MLPAIIAIVIIVFLIIMYVNIKNRLVKEEVNIQTALSDAKLVIDRRFKNIESTINLMKEHNEQLKTIMTDVMSLRKTGTLASYAEAETKLQEVVKQIDITVENYPQIGQLFDSASFMQLMAKHDRDVEMAKKSYNHEVEQFNTLILSIPYSFFAASKKSYDFWAVENVETKDEYIAKF